MALLRKLVLRFRPFPSQTAYSLLNYLVSVFARSRPLVVHVVVNESVQFGFVMYYVRSPCEGSQDAIAMALSLAWLVAPSVHGLYFKDLKQTLRKEQCDVSCDSHLVYLHQSYFFYFLARSHDYRQRAER